MLSRCSLFGGQSLKKCIIKFQPVSAITTSAVAGDAAKSGGSDPSKYPPEFPPAGPKRDFVNFPRLTMKEVTPPVRLGFIPDSWFQAFYPKTGYTGPYMLLGGAATYILSKEILVYDHNAVHMYAFIFLLWFIQYKFGDQIAKVYIKMINEDAAIFDNEQERDKNILRKELQKMEGKKVMKDAIVEITKARTEMVQMELESNYRERMLQAYKAVKSRLDCQVELENAQNRASQKNVMDYVMRNVMKSITPELEKSALQTCISDLNALAAKA